MLALDGELRPPSLFAVSSLHGCVCCLQLVLRNFQNLNSTAPNPQSLLVGNTVALRACRVWGPKVQPWSKWQASIAHQQPLAFSLLFSSVASLLGSAGQANYAAANSALDAAAAADNAMGISTTSVRWGAWAGKCYEERSVHSA